MKKKHILNKKHNPKSNIYFIYENDIIITNTVCACLYSAIGLTRNSKKEFCCPSGGKINYIYKMYILKNYVKSYKPFNT